MYPILGPGVFCYGLGSHGTTNVREREGCGGSVWCVLWEVALFCSFIFPKLQGGVVVQSEFLLGNCFCVQKSWRWDSSHVDLLAKKKCLEWVGGRNH